jgi:hypothetical protein
MVLVEHDAQTMLPNIDWAYVPLTAGWRAKAMRSPWRRITANDNTSSKQHVASMNNAPRHSLFA